MVKCQLVNSKGMRKFANHHLTNIIEIEINIIEIIDSVRDNQEVLTLYCENLIGEGIFAYSQSIHS